MAAMHFMRHLPPTATPIDWRVQRAAYSGQPADVTRFRSALEGYLGVQSCFLASSGRTALFMLLSAIHRSTPDPTRSEVVLPAYTCPSVAKVVIDAHLRPRFVDVGPYTLSYNVTELSTAVSERTLAVIVVHPFGIPQVTDVVMQIANSCGARVIEDAAQSLGAKAAGRYIGTTGDFGLFSLGPGKPLSTGGGGFVCTSNDAAADLLRNAWKDLSETSAANAKLAAVRLGAFGMAFHPRGWWLATRLGALRLGENESSWGYSLRGLSAAQAAAGLALLPRFDEINSARRHRGEELAAALRTIPSVHLPGLTSARDARRSESAEDQMEPIFLRLPIVFESDRVREAAARALHSTGVGAGRMYRRSLPALFPEFGEGVYPGAEHVARCLLTLPTHHYVTDADIVRMAQTVAGVVQVEADAETAFHATG